jgi:PAS domain-containing protein
MPQGVSRAVIEVLLDRVGQGAGTLSPEGHLTYANQRLATMLGMNRAQLIGKPLVELVADAERDALSSTLESARDTAAQCRLVLPRSNGSGPMPALLTFAPLGHGQLSCIVTELGRNGTKEADSAPQR